MTNDTSTVLLGAREVPLAWTKRAQYRLASLASPHGLDAARDPARAFAFLCQHAWAMLAEERDRRAFPQPDDIAQQLDIDDQAGLQAIWGAVFSLAYGVRLDPEGAVQAPAPAGEDGQPGEHQAARGGKLRLRASKSA